MMGRRQVAKTRDFDSRIRRFESSRPSFCEVLMHKMTKVSDFRHFSFKNLKQL